MPWVRAVSALAGASSRPTVGAEAGTGDLETVVYRLVQEALTNVAATLMPAVPR